MVTHWSDVPCDVWPARRSIPGGYGVTHVAGVLSPQYVHRLAWTETNGPIPPGMCVLHRCDNPPCREVAHLFLGTKADNAADRDRKGRTARVCGEANHRARLTDQQVAAIRSSPLPPKQIARDYGVTRDYVYMIRSGLRRPVMEVQKCPG